MKCITNKSQHSQQITYLLYTWEEGKLNNISESVKKAHNKN
jgi:hypothetical protein